MTERESLDQVADLLLTFGELAQRVPADRLGGLLTLVDVDQAGDGS